MFIILFSKIEKTQLYELQLRLHKKANHKTKIKSVNCVTAIFALRMKWVCTCEMLIGIFGTQ